MARDAPFRERNIRRWHILRGRITRSMPGQGPRYPSVFMHMPKCGGTSLSEAMYGTVPFADRLGVIDAPSTRRAAAILRANRDDLLTCHEDLDTGQPIKWQCVTQDVDRTPVGMRQPYGTALPIDLIDHMLRRHIF